MPSMTTLESPQAERIRHQLQAACLTGDQKQLEALLTLHDDWYERLRCFPGRTSTLPHASAQQTDLQVVRALLCTPRADDGASTTLHYICTGSPLGMLGRLLWLSSGGSLSEEVQPGRHDGQRAQLLAWLLAHHPEVLALLCHRNAAGVTPLHCSLRSASAEALKVLLAAVSRLPPPVQRLALAVPGASGQPPPLELALQLHQWEAVQLLVGAGAHLLAHDYLLVAQQVAQQLQPHAPGLASDKKGPSTGGLARAVTGAVRSAFGQLVDLMAGQTQEREAVERHLQQRQRRQAQQAGFSAAGGSGRGGGSSERKGAGGEVEVLQGTADVARLRREQIESTAQVLGVTGPEAAALLATHGWDELAAVQAQLGPGGKVSGAAAATAAGAAGPAATSGAGQESHGAGPSSNRAVGASGAVGLAAILDAVGPGQPAAVGQQPGLVDSSNGSGGGISSQLAAAAAAAASGSSREGTEATQHPHQHSASEEEQGEAVVEAEAGPCIVCYEECGGGGAWQGLPCRHRTCDACWRGILLAQLDTGEVHRVVCPEPGCGMPLPLEAAGRLLSPPQHQRFQQLLAQSYVEANPSLRWCPRPGCGNVVRLVGQGGSGAAAGAARLRGAAATGRGVNVQCVCGASFCWACSGDPHEPATCEQARRWRDELAALREAAPSKDMEWIEKHTKRCPACTAPIEKHGGCMHMTCCVCRHQWCWACGRSWAEHSQETGGHYHCILVPRTDLPDFAHAAPLPLGPLGWLRDAWGALQSLSAQHTLQQHLRQFVRHDFNPAHLTLLATHVQRLLGVVGACTCSLALGYGAGARPGPLQAPPAHAAAAAADAHTRTGGGATASRQEGDSCPPHQSQYWEDAELGPASLLGMTLSEAASMSREEWGQLVAAAALSLAESGQLGGSGDMPAGTCAAHAAGAGRGSILGAESSAVSVGTSPCPAAACSGATAAAAAGASCCCADLARLAQQLAAAHAALQHASVAAWALGGYGPRRRFLAKLSEGIERRVVRLEGLLMGMPEREAAIQCQQHHFRPDSVWAAGGQRLGGLMGRMLRSMYGVAPPHLQPPTPAPPPPPAASDQLQQGQQQGQHGCLPCRSTGPIASGQQQQQQQAWLQGCLARGLPREHLKRQAHFALALQHQRRQLGAELAALEAAVAELLQAGRAGLFSS